MDHIQKSLYKLMYLDSITKCEHYNTTLNKCMCGDEQKNKCELFNKITALSKYLKHVKHTDIQGVIKNGEYVCPMCEKAIDRFEEKCPHCGQHLLYVKKEFKEGESNEN